VHAHARPHCRHHRAPRWLYGVSAAAGAQAAAASWATPAANAAHLAGPCPAPGGPGSGRGGHGGGGGSGGAAANPITTLAANQEPITLTVASFAVTKLAYVKLTRMFREHYQKTKGRDVKFRLTFAGSGVQVGGSGGLPAGGTRRSSAVLPGGRVQRRGCWRLRRCRGAGGGGACRPMLSSRPRPADSPAGAPSAGSGGD
jgi:hypothetical protein